MLIFYKGWKEEMGGILIILAIEIAIFFINILLFLNINSIISSKFTLTRKLIVEQNKKIRLLEDELEEIEKEELKAII